MKSKSKIPKSWTEVYPHGTQEGDEEQAVFIFLSRHPKWIFRSVAAISKESGIDKERVEEILYKYWKKDMVFQNPLNEDQWAYWERVPEMLPAEECSLTDLDHNSRIDDLLWKEV